ncbi:hypothetical protein JQ604_01820 [Bradyrhizobium jicamae]|uniref:hypothetical protein n=1 Tax=Bradyrhizobium jicamae TaxID=280332 RepID=UPI001BAA6392|nr:hypothetical protein [Bradyrhizobium jicamae]MBR0750903.1 hypothetical protein [Bradyrhizobium jicamae]
MVQINVLERPVQRIREACELMGHAERFERALPELETFLESKVADGESSESMLTSDGLRYLRRRFANSGTT